MIQRFIYIVRVKVKHLQRVGNILVEDHIYKKLYLKLLHKISLYFKQEPTMHR